MALPFRRWQESACRSGRCRVASGNDDTGRGEQDREAIDREGVRGPRRAIYRHLRPDKATEFVTPRNFIPAGINFDLSSANDLIGALPTDRRAR